MIWGIQDQDAGKKKSDNYVHDFTYILIHLVSLSSVARVISCIFMYYIHTHTYLVTLLTCLCTDKTKVVKHGD